MNSLLCEACYKSHFYIIFKKHSIMKTYFTTMIAVLLSTSYLSAQQDTTGAGGKQPATYESMKKSATTRMIVGGVAMVGGATLFITQGQKAVGAELASAFGATSVNSNASAGVALAGFIFFLGGTGLLISGISKSSKANKWKAAGKFNLEANTPPIQIAPKVTVVQQGFTLGISIGK